MRPILPNLLVPGVEKGGTTSLYAYLSQHPQICASQVKELNYLFQSTTAHRAERALTEYTKHYTHHQGEPYRLEVSPAYWYGGPQVRAAVAQTLGHPRVVVSLREPASRFWSAFTFLQSMGRLDHNLSVERYFEDCLDVERRQADLAERTRHTPLSVGLYHSYLVPWLEVFGANVKVVFAEVLFASPKAVVVDLCEWLGIDSGVAEQFDYQARNVTINPRSLALAKMVDAAGGLVGRWLWRQQGLRRVLVSTYRAVNSGGGAPALDSGTRERIEAFYAASNRDLRDELTRRGGPDLPSWLTSSS